MSWIFIEPEEARELLADLDALSDEDYASSMHHFKTVPPPPGEEARYRALARVLPMFKEVAAQATSLLPRPPVPEPDLDICSQCGEVVVGAHGNCPGIPHESGE